MASLLTSTRNTRLLIPGSLRFLRSDVPDQLSSQDIQWLLAHNVLAIVDLREDTERASRPCALREDPRFQYHYLPVTGGNAIPPHASAVSQSYAAMADSQMERIIGTILDAPTNVLYFCNAGKDRTGVVSAILLQKMGFPDSYIVADYMASKENLRPMLEAYATAFPQIDIQIITPQPRYIEEFLAWYQE